MTASKALATTKKAPARAKPTGEVVVADYVISGVPSLEQFKEAVREGAKFYLEDEGETGSFLAETLDRAETTADLFGGDSELLKVEQNLGTVFTLLGIDAVRRSDFADGMGIYLVVSATDPDGELIKLAIGNQSGIGVILGIAENGDFPWKVSFERSQKATKRGFYPINILNRQTLDKTGKKVDF